MAHVYLELKQLAEKFGIRKGIVFSMPAKEEIKFERNFIETDYSLVCRMYRKYFGLQTSALQVTDGKGTYWFGIDMQKGTVI